MVLVAIKSDRSDNINLRKYTYSKWLQILLGRNVNGIMCSGFLLRFLRNETVLLSVQR